MQRFMWLLAAAVAIGVCLPAQASGVVKRSLCLYDPVGANGMIAQQFQSYLIWAQSHGVAFKLHTYTDENVVAKDLRAGRCDAAGLTGIRAKEFVNFAGSLDMVGGLQTYAEEHTAIQVMASAKAAPLMKQGPYEVAAVLPGGKVYLFSRKKKFLDSLQAASGKKIAVIGYDKQADVVANMAGASPVQATIASFGPMFNNHSVDMAYAPAIVYKPMELYKGLGKDGGVADFVLGMLSLQLVIHADRFPDGFAAASRKWALDNGWGQIMPLIRRADQSIPQKYWVHISGKRATKYRTMLTKIRQKLWNDGWYNHRMQHLLKKIRCQNDPSIAECSEDTEGGPVH